MSNETSFDLKAFLEESKQTLLNPSAYFENMKTAGGMTEPIIKAVLYGLIAGIFGFLWGILNLGAMGGGLFGGAVGVMILVWSVVGAVIGLFIGAVIILVLSSIAKGSTDFESCVRISAALMVLSPIRAFFGFLTGLNLYLGLLVSLAIGLYMVYMLYYSLVKTLKAEQGTSRIISYVLVGLIVLMMLVGMGTRKRAARFLDRDFDKRTEKAMKELQEKMDEAAKEMENSN